MTEPPLPGTVYGTDEPEHFGRIPVRTELTVLSADKPGNKVTGFQVHETVGIGIVRAFPACPICGDHVMDLLEHARDQDDPDHEVLSIMAT